MSDVSIEPMPEAHPVEKGDEGDGPEKGRKYRIAAVGDLHVRVDRPGRIRRFFSDLNERADLLLLAGDLTDHGSEEEGELLAEELANVRIPKIAVFGNHDYESGKQVELCRVLSKGGIRVLDGDVFVFEHKLAIAGVKGFAGGFDTATLEPWGEEIIKKFVFEAVNESLKLEMALARVKGLEKKIALMHYAPIRGTVEGENPEIAAFLGCSRLLDPAEKFGAAAIVHGHAHRGTIEAKSERGTPVFNVAMALLKAKRDQRYVVFEV